MYYCNFVKMLKNLVFSQEDSEFSYQNPVSRGNFPDPGVLFIPQIDRYVTVTTSNYASNNHGPAFPIQWSSDLVNWTLV
jgi:beta-xylosidase